ncbi:MAG: putative two-component system sensor kinase [Ilumatobacteraceae bacterium]|nr:putative two-component system sensor kinase [Ilumatobacteraceae bacterium]MCU1390807.1 putative two-component system sensor kinase [Ilumatobacteraceae bacterium]
MARRRRSLRLRVTAAAGGLIAVVLVVGAIAVAGLLRRALEEDTQALLNQQIDEVAALAQSGELPEDLQAKGREIGQIQVYDASHHLVAATTGFAETSRLDIIAEPTGVGSRLSTVSGGRIDSDPDERYRIEARSIETPKGRYVIYGVSSLKAADNAVRTLALALLAGVPLFVGVATWVLWRSVGRALGPVDAMRAEVDDIEASSMERRVTAPDTDDELGRLGRTLNHLLDRLDADAQRQRQFAADASHELRSPLASARTQLEVGLAYPDRADWTTTATDVLLEIDRLERLSGELLDFARTDARGRLPTLHALDLAELIDRAVTSTPPGDVPITWTMPSRPMPVLGDDDLLTRVLRNLLSNAQRHARTRITVTNATDRIGYRLTFANDGIPIDAEDRERIFEPFTRLDAARASDAGGAGLGLAISRRIARSHGGDLVCAAVGDDVAFVLSLPMAKLALG